MRVPATTGEPCTSSQPPARRGLRRAASPATSTVTAAPTGPGHRRAHRLPGRLGRASRRRRPDQRRRAPAHAASSPPGRPCPGHRDPDGQRPGDQARLGVGPGDRRARRRPDLAPAPATSPSARSTATALVKTGVRRHQRRAARRRGRDQGRVGRRSRSRAGRRDQPSSRPAPARSTSATPPARSALKSGSGDLRSASASHDASLVDRLRRPRVGRMTAGQAEPQERLRRHPARHPRRHPGVDRHQHQHRPGPVRRSTPTGAPADGQDHVEVRAKSVTGDIYLEQL